MLSFQAIRVKYLVTIFFPNITFSVTSNKDIKKKDTKHVMLVFDHIRIILLLYFIWFYSSEPLASLNIRSTLTLQISDAVSQVVLLVCVCVLDLVL